MEYDLKCSGCNISQGLTSRPGGILKLPGDWIANQYGGGEGFLGWLALQPRFHRMCLSDLTRPELENLGPNIGALDAALSEYWKRQFPADRIKRVYVVYFFESAFEQPPPAEQYHLHIHIIPRFDSLAEPLTVQGTGPRWPDGWRIPLLNKAGQVPEPYQRRSPMWENRATALMDFLRHELAARP